MIRVECVQNKKKMTTQAQQPSQLTTLHAWNFFWEPTKPHKWLGCLPMVNMGNREQDVNYRLHKAPRAVQANKWILCGKLCR